MILNQTALGTSAGNPAESRVEILHWLNSHLQLSLKRVEECGTGAVYCQIIDSIYRIIVIYKVTNYFIYNHLFVLINFFFLRGCADEQGQIWC